MKLHVLLLIALPTCLAQFSIQGPSDGNRRAQGLKYSQEKGIEYSDQNESQGAGDFTIQGATDGNSEFRIQGASDGHSDFQIQGANDGGASRFLIQGATDGHSQSVIQGPYDHNQAAPTQQRQSVIQSVYDGSGGAGKSLEYNDPNGLRVNWRSYERQQQPQAQPQYVEPAAARQQPRRGHSQRAYAAPQPQERPAPPPVYTNYNNAPSQIKQLLQFQAQIPYVNSIPEQYRYESLAAMHAQIDAQQAQYQSQSAEAPQRPAYRTKASRHRRQAQQSPLKGLRRISQPPAEPQPKYSGNLPQNLQHLLQYQSQAPYVNVIPEQYRFDPTPAIQEQAQKVKAHYQQLAAEGQQQQRQQHAPRRQKRQAPGYQHGNAQPQYRNQQPQNRNQQQQYRRISQPPAEPQPQYSTNAPGHIQNLLKFQSQIPYNIFANQIKYRPEKPYVPQAAKPSQLSQAQYQGQGGAYHSQGVQLQNQAGAYQGGQVQYQNQAAAYQGAQYPQPGYGRAPAGVRPVTEKQY